jgi:hypothetical protein
MVHLFLFLFFCRECTNRLLFCVLSLSLFGKLSGLVGRKEGRKQGSKLKRKGKMGFEPAVQMWSLRRYEAEKGRGAGWVGTWKMGYPTKGGGGGPENFVSSRLAKCAQLR